MKDCFDMVTDIRSLLNVTALTGLIDGKVHSNIRPDGSVKTDVVVNAIGITNNAEQVGYGNVNIHAPEIISGGVNVTDQGKLMALGKVAATLIDEQYKKSFRCEVVEAPHLSRDADNTYYVNIGYKYYSVQDNYTNI